MTENPNAPANTNALGKRVLSMYAAGTATRDQLDTAYYLKNWISTADYKAAIANAPAAENAASQAAYGQA